MADTGKFKRIPEDVREMAHFAQEQQLGHGRIEFDELGNAIWVPFSGAQGKDVLSKLLDDPIVYHDELTDADTAPIPFSNPGIISIPLSFITLVVVSLMTSSTAAAQEAKTAELVP